ncbi:MAG: cell division protein CdvB3 [Saccharolobus sp.]
MRKKGVTIAELLIDVRIARSKITDVINRMKNKVDVYNEMFIKNVNSFPHLSKMIARESEFLEKVLYNLLLLETMLEILEIKIETIIYVGYIVNSAPAVIEAIKGVKDSFGIMPEISNLLDSIYENFYIVIDIPKDVKVSIKEEAKNIISEAEKIAKKRENEIYYQVNT